MLNANGNAQWPNERWKKNHEEEEEEKEKRIDTICKLLGMRGKGVKPANARRLR